MTEIKVTGMTCGGCVNSVKRAVERVLPGAKPEVELETGRLRIDTPSGAPPDTLARLVGAIEDAGFGAEVRES